MKIKSIMIIISIISINLSSCFYVDPHAGDKEYYPDSIKVLTVDGDTVIISNTVNPSGSRNISVHKKAKK